MAQEITNSESSFDPVDQRVALDEDGRVLAVERNRLLRRASRRGEGENSGFVRSNLFRLHKTKVVVLELARSAKELKL